MTDTPRPVSPELTADIRELLRPHISNPEVRTIIVTELVPILQSVDANAHARGRAEAAAIVEAVLANVDELVEASSPDAEIAVDQATVVRGLLREALGAADTDTQADKRAAWAEGARFAYGYTSGMTPDQIDTGGPLPDWIADRNPYGPEFPGTTPDESTEVS